MRAISDTDRETTRECTWGNRFSNIAVLALMISKNPLLTTLPQGKTPPMLVRKSEHINPKTERQNIFLHRLPRCRGQKINQHTFRVTVAYEYYLAGTRFES